MTDAPVVHIGENSPEQVAFRLMEMIANIEKKALSTPKNIELAKILSNEIADRKWILDTYAECLHAVRGFREFRGHGFRNYCDDCDER